MMKTLSILIVLTTLILSACGSSTDSPQPQDIGVLDPVPAEYAGKTNPLGPDAATDGAKIYQVNCETCHGPQGHGDGPVGPALDPAPKNLPELAANVGDDYLFWRVADGKPGTSMPPWKNILTEEQIWQIVAFMRTLK